MDNENFYALVEQRFPNDLDSACIETGDGTRIRHEIVVPYGHASTVLTWTVVRSTAPVVSQFIWDRHQDQFPFNEGVPPGDNAAFDTTTALMNTGLNIVAPATDPAISRHFVPHRVIPSCFVASPTRTWASGPTCRRRRRAGMRRHCEQRKANPRTRRGSWRSWHRLLPRLQLFEFVDAAWAPAPLRDSLVEALVRRAEEGKDDARQELAERMAGPLEFGTAGLRGRASSWITGMRRTRTFLTATGTKRMGLGSHGLVSGP